MSATIVPDSHCPTRMHSNKGSRRHVVQGPRALDWRSGIGLRIGRPHHFEVPDHGIRAPRASH